MRILMIVGVLLFNLMWGQTAPHTTIHASSTGSYVVAWGDDYFTVPTGLTNVIAIAAGNDHSLALKRDGTVVAWGISGPIPVPTNITKMPNIAAGEYHSHALVKGYINQHDWLNIITMWDNLFGKDAIYMSILTESLLMIWLIDT